ncbi:EamA-like transporter family [Carpediemonas membranifera]|uniref:EamA-like transporter family n=1 Tax=Carpediemonas membranifera TaxID=201153 RepID=A0A8J6AQH3_9EUKA|nr:EamA-like transporter family [Carpediemonas membranifera]|eukprot:KAG9391411.1 EamA-like transporter family [Carpediemonas membranifera]
MDTQDPSTPVHYNDSKRRNNVKFITTFIISSLSKVLIGFLFVATKYCLPYFDPLLFSALRLTMASVLLFPFLVPHIRKLVATTKSHPHALLLYPLYALCTATSPVFINYAAQYTTVSNIGILTSLMPAYSFVLSVCLGHEKLTLVSITAVLVAMVAALGIVDMSTISVNLSDSVGIILMVAQGVFGAVFNELTKEFVSMGFDSVSISVVSFIGAGALTWSCWLILAPFHGLYTFTPNLLDTSLRAWVSLLYAGVFGTAVVWLVVAWSARQLSAVAISTQMLIVPPVSSILGTLFFDDPTGVGTVLNMFEVLLGLLLLATRKPRTKTAPAVEEAQETLETDSPILEVKSTRGDSDSDSELESKTPEDISLSAIPSSFDSYPILEFPEHQDLELPSDP